MKVMIEELKKLNYEDGVTLLEENGYFDAGSGAPDGAEARAIKVGDCFLTDIYYTLEDEDGEYTVSFVQKWEKGESAEEDKLIEEFWEEA